MSLNIVVVEDNPIIALDLTSYIRKQRFTAVYSSSNVADALSLLNSLDHALVFLDIHLDVKYGGIEIARELEHKKGFPYAYITANTDSNTLEKIKGTHPIGFIVKPFQEEEVKALLVLGTHRIKHPVDKPEVNKALIKRTFPNLTTAEVNVFMGLYNGSSNQEIATTLFVSVDTVKSHLKSIFVKLDVSSRLKAVQVLLRNI